MNHSRIEEMTIEKEIISPPKRMLRKWVLIFKKEVHQDSKTKRKKKPLKIMIRI